MKKTLLSMALMLGGLGVIAGAAIFALGKPLRNAMGRKV